MTPKEKAGWINERFYFALPNNGSFTGINSINDRWKDAKKCALIAVDEIMNALDENGSWNYDYWNEVKQEIEKL
jgi:hypothetical protein